MHKICSRLPIKILCLHCNVCASGLRGGWIGQRNFYWSNYGLAFRYPASSCFLIRLDRLASGGEPIHLVHKPLQLKFLARLFRGSLELVDLTNFVKKEHCLLLSEG